MRFHFVSCLLNQSPLSLCNVDDILVALLSLGLCASKASFPGSLLIVS